MKKILIIGAIDLDASIAKLSESCIELNDSIKITTENFDEFRTEVILKQEYKHPFDKFINCKKKRR